MMCVGCRQTPKRESGRIGVEISERGGKQNPPPPDPPTRTTTSSQRETKVTGVVIADHQRRDLHRSLARSIE